jgi:hypothetical protein
MDPLSEGVVRVVDDVSQVVETAANADAGLGKFSTDSRKDRQHAPVPSLFSAQSSKVYN